jgi:hypothetical protein
MDQIQRELDSIRWNYADGDPATLAEFARRIRDAVRSGKQTLTYSELAAGVTFHLPNVNDGQPYQIDVHDWENLDRAIVGDFLGKIDADSYRAGRFFASAMVISAERNMPSPAFFELARQVKLLRARGQDAELEFWTEQLNLSRTWFQANEL